MVKKTENGFSIAPFLLKCYEMVDDQSTNALISWDSSNDSFTIWNVTEFSSKLLPKYFKHSNFSSFVRQLNIYGFRKIDTDRWVFASDQFIKGQKHLLKNINRRKQKGLLVQQQKTTEEEVVGCEEVGGMIWKEVETLKTDKIALMQELGILRQHQQTSRSKILVLRQQLHGMEINQQQMLSFLVTAMQNPGLLVQLLQQPKENKWCRGGAEGGKKVVVKRGIIDEDPEEVVPSEGAIVPYQAQPMVDDGLPIIDDNTLECNFSSDELRDIFMNIDMDFLSTPESPPLGFPNHLLLPNGDDDDDDDDDSSLLILEHLLSPPLEIEEPSNSGRDVELAPSSEFDFVKEEELDKSHHQSLMMMDTSAFENQVDNFQYMETITEQMGLLASESSSSTLGY